MSDAHPIKLPGHLAYYFYVSISIFPSLDSTLPVPCPRHLILKRVNLPFTVSEWKVMRPLDFPDKKRNRFSDLGPYGRSMMSESAAHLECLILKGDYTVLAFLNV